METATKYTCINTRNNTDARLGVLGKRTCYSRARVSLRYRVYCSFVLHMAEGPRIYSANGVRHRQYMFRRVPFRVE